MLTQSPIHNNQNTHCWYTHHYSHIHDDFCNILQLILGKTGFALASRHTVMKVSFDEGMSFNFHIKRTSRMPFISKLSLQKSGKSCLKKMQKTSPCICCNSILLDCHSKSLKTLQCCCSCSTHKVLTGQLRQNSKCSWVTFNCQN